MLAQRLERGGEEGRARALRKRMDIAADGAALRDECRGPDRHEGGGGALEPHGHRRTRDRFAQRAAREDEARERDVIEP